MRNITQNIKFMACNIIPEKLSPELASDLVDVIAAENNKTDKQTLLDKKENLLKRCSNQIVAQLNSIGAKYPSDRVEVYMNLSDFLFDLYAASAPKPESPLGKKLADKKLHDLSEVLNSDEFNLPDWSLEPIRRSLSTDSIWTKMNVSVYVKVNNEKKYFSINTKGANNFNEVLDAATSAFGE